MSLRRDRILPIAAFAVLAALGVLVLVLLADAASSGRTALREAVEGEVEAIARSQNSRVVAQLAGGSGLAEDDWDLVPNSASDADRLDEILDLVPDLRSGFFVTDADGVITQGVQLEDRSDVGRPYDRADFLAAFDDSAFAAGRGALLRVAPGVTTDLPTVAFVYPIFGPAGVRGSFVFEQVVTADSDFNAEIGELQRGDTGEYLVYDAAGQVLASNDPSMIGDRVSAEEFLDVPTGFTTDGDDILVIAEVPAATWRIAFTQDRSEFESGLAGPLQQVGQIVVVAFVGFGVAAFVGLTRRLRAAREEQARLRQLAETQDEFISIVSHELRTPVAGVLGFLQTTTDHWGVMDDQQRLDAVRRAASNARRLQGLTRDVLDSQSVESGRMAYVMTEVDLSEEIEVAVEAATALHPQHTIRLVSDVDDAPAFVDVDRIQQVLTNLLDNAVRASPPDDEIELRVVRHGGALRIEVRDRGPGLSDDMRSRVFDKFVRGPGSDVDGTGLGLFISRRIVEAHGGTITVDSPSTGGAVFVVTLPMSTAAVAD